LSLEVLILGTVDWFCTLLGLQVCMIWDDDDGNCHGQLGNVSAVQFRNKQTILIDSFGVQKVDS
jgi:hypothetical protein